MLDALNVGMLMMGRKPEAEVEKACLLYTSLKHGQRVQVRNLYKIRNLK